MLWHCWLSDRKGIYPACKKLDVGLLVIMIWLSFAWLTAPVVTTTSVILQQETQLSIADKPRDAFSSQGHQTIRYLRYGFLLVCYSNFVHEIFDFENVTLNPRLHVTEGHRNRYWSIRGPSRTVSKINGDLSRKLQIFPTPSFCTTAEGVPLGIGYWRGGQKTRMMRLPGREWSLTISSAIWI